MQTDFANPEVLGKDTYSGVQVTKYHYVEDLGSGYTDYTWYVMDKTGFTLYEDAKIYAGDELFSEYVFATYAYRESYTTVFPTDFQTI